MKTESESRRRYRYNNSAVSWSLGRVVRTNLFACRRMGSWNIDRWTSTAVTCCVDGLRKFVRDGLLRGNHSHGAVSILQLVAVDGAGKSVLLNEACALTKLNVIVAPEGDSCPSVEVTEGLCRDAIF